MAALSYDGYTIDFDNEDSNPIFELQSTVFCPQINPEASPPYSYPNLCWAACVRMVQSAVGMPVMSFDDIVHTATGAANAVDGDKSAWPENIYPALGIPFAGWNGSFDFDQIQASLRANSPVQYLLEWDDGGGHTALIVGYYGNSDVYIMDPLYGYGPVKLSEITSAYGFNGKWTKTYNQF